MKTSYAAHGKVILIGEHAVVYGYDALAVPAKTLQIVTSVEPIKKDFWMDTPRYHGPLFTAPEEFDGIKYIVRAMKAKAYRRQALKITYEGEIPMQRGLGSSAVVALGTTEALNEYYHLHLDHDDIMAIANHAEMINHGKASGLDAATVAASHAVYFSTKTGIEELNDKLGSFLVIMDTGDLGNTKEAVAQVHDLFVKERTVRQNMRALGKLSPAFKKAFLAGDAATCGDYFNQAQEILASFNLSTDKIDQICAIANQNGAYGAKLSGGGLGGIVIALVPDPTVGQKIINLCRSQIEHAWIEEI
ncbi:MAG: mevalonate kinase [Lactobacillus sp.]|nr:mevalonate kinase [Lactobacillus sp.]MCH3906276.1 mevalonate kinase [Lactobacillus sp.]MCH3990148.1 mevalonate kinase [Lactobacillus sp.]MCH4069138.1 mevalonate kinase [Lactobacillus sp.]MCI1303875.1 mevalonate kinase [Lactobacillus sp.]